MIDYCTTLEKKVKATTLSRMQNKFTLLQAYKKFTSIKLWEAFLVLKCENLFSNWSWLEGTMLVYNQPFTLRN